jgi:hypothetical protein
MSYDKLERFIKEAVVKFVGQYAGEEEWIVENEQLNIPKKFTKVYMKRYDSFEDKIAELEYHGKTEEIEKLLDGPQGFFYDKDDFVMEGARKEYDLYMTFKNNGWDVQFIDANRLEKAQLRARSRRRNAFSNCS